MASRKSDAANTGSKVKGLIRCHKCQLKCRDSRHYLNHKCEPTPSIALSFHCSCPPTVDNAPSEQREFSQPADRGILRASPLVQEPQISQKIKRATKPSVCRYVSSFQAERFHRGVRYHWMVCWQHKPDELVSWGHAPTQELAEAAARDEIHDLSSGVSKGGRVTSRNTSSIHHR